MEYTITTFTKNKQLYIKGKDIPKELDTSNLIKEDEIYPVFIKFYSYLDKTSPIWRKYLNKDGNQFDFELDDKHIVFGLHYGRVTLILELEEEVYAEVW